jgi:hypothetical protein
MTALLTGQEPHPTLPLPTADQVARHGKEWIDRFYRLRRQMMLDMESDPLNYGYEPPSWKRADDALAQFRREHPVGVIICLILGGHRAAKTEWRSKRTVQNLFKHRDYKVWGGQATQEASREAQQSKIYKYLPPAYRVQSGKLRQGAQLKVNYTPWGGFTEDVFAVVNEHGGTSECRFKFYSMNPRSLEGAEIDEGWLDEEAPLEWMEAVTFRLVSRNGVLFLTFTPRWGYTQTVKAVLSGAETLLDGNADTDLLAVRDARGNIIAAQKVPLLQRNLNVGLPGSRGKATIVYFHTSENPFPLGNWSQMKATLMGASDEKILTVAYGVPTKSMMARFPLFRKATHVVSLNRFREIQKGGGTWFHFLDPCSGRNWFQIWIFLDCLNRAFVAGESPSFDHEWAYIPGVGNPGPWAVPGNKADGEQGDGQKEWGWGYHRYLEEIERMERLLALRDVVPTGRSSVNDPPSPGYGVAGEARMTNDERISAGNDKARHSHTTPPKEPDEPGSPAESLLTNGAHRSDRPTELAEKISINARWIDARYGNARRTQQERSTTLIEDLSDLGMDFYAAPSEKVIDSGRGGGDGSLRMINDRLFFDVKREIDHTNQPHLYCVETCPNTIYALEEWSGKDGQHGATKDPIDCLRMFVLSGSEFVDPALLQPITPWMKQFQR